VHKYILSIVNILLLGDGHPINTQFDFNQFSLKCQTATPNWISN